MATVDDSIFSKNILEGLFAPRKDESEEEIKKKFQTLKPKVKVMPYRYDKLKGLGSYFAEKAKELKADAQALGGESTTITPSVADKGTTQGNPVAPTAKEPDKQKILDEVKKEVLSNADKNENKNAGQKYAELKITEDILKALNGSGKSTGSEEAEEELDHFSKRYTFDEDKARNQNGMLRWTPKTAKEYSSLSPEGYFRKKFINDNRRVLRDQFVQEALKKKGAPLTDEEIKQAEQKAEQSKMWQGEIPSTAIKRAKYNRDTQEFKVMFTGTSPSAQIWYTYPDVPPEVVNQFKEALSKGEFFLKNIHDQYTTNPGHKRKSKAA